MGVRGVIERAAARSTGRTGRHIVRRVLAVALALTGVGLTACASLGPRARGATSGAIGTYAGASDRVPRVAFRSDFWLNLHHLLYQQARARRGVADASYPATVGAGTDTAGFGALGDDTRAGWDRALAYYDSAFASLAIDHDSALVETSYALAGRADTPLRPGLGLPAGLVAALADAAPAYRATAWPRHDAANRAWAAAMLALLDQHGTTLVAALERVYRVPWPRRPVPVEVVAYANWAGAYTTLDPTLVTMSSLYRGHRGTLGLEQLVHEVSHGMTDSVDVARDAAHAIVFYAAGSLVQGVVPDHQPFAEWRGFWTSDGPLARYHAALVGAWGPYLEGRTTLRDAIGRFVALIPPDAPRPGR